ncbi:PD-(D/E)XK nuclease family protein [Subtercola sp. RTI3]|uniref:PD-(D/E)XK nuclease family protein n=1 Tax=Subtercola sp. RTI3 TaxID=3048639 RepID=UPI002B226F0D|nr:PD-(D/E)XK nuclease family protein [Subtercola sp. RTI3]MEA9987064.1 PD-(D/E)XK nuclease family protein [Subtercola sp. RTI3]
MTSADLPPLFAEVARIYTGAAAAVRAGWATDARVFERAVEALTVPGIRASLGTVIGFALPELLSPLESRLLAAARALTGFVDVEFSASDEVVDSALIITVPDADEEGREVARQVVELVREGQPANRIGVFWDAASPYRVLLVKHLADAGIEVNGQVGRQLADTSVARSVLRLLELDRSAIDPRAVLHIIADGAVSWRDGKLPSSAQCERIFAREPLEEPLEKQTVRFVDPEAEGGETQAASGTVFDQYLAAIAASLERLTAATSWTAASTALVDFLGTHFSAPRSDEGIAALAQLGEVATRLSFLDRVAPSPTLFAIRECIESAIAGAVARTGTIGQGVSLGPLQSGVARDLDTVFIVGLAEGVTPSRQREDPLIPDSVRPVWGLPTIAQRALARRQLFRDVGASASKKLVLTAPRGDLRGGGDRELSRWLTKSATASAIELGSHHAGILTGSPAQPTVPTTAEMWRLRALLADRPVPASEIVALAQLLRADRRLGHFTRFTGNLHDVRDLIRATDEAVSATNLEDWVSGPYFYFLRHILGVRPWDLSQEEIEPDMLDVGTITHRILELFTLQAIAGGDKSIDALLETAQTVFAEAAQSTWIRHLWQRRKSEIVRNLEAWWAREVGSEAWSPRSAEASFGPSDDNDGPSVTVALPGAGEIRFRGKVDRIDHHVDGRIRVIDYKAGSNKKYEGLSETSPTAGGHLFQLPVYALFARSQSEALENMESGSVASVAVGYDFVFGGGELGYAVTDAVIEEFLTDVQLVITAIKNGIFPPRKSGGAFRPYADLMAPGEFDDLWQRLLLLPELAAVARLWAEDTK